EKHSRGHSARDGSEPVLQPLVGRVLRSLEVSGEEERRDSDPPDEITETDLEEREVAPRRDAGNGDHGERGRFGRDHRKHQCPPGESPMAEEVVGGVPLAAGPDQAERDHPRAVRRDDDYVEGAHGRAGWGAKKRGPRNSRASYVIRSRRTKASDGERRSAAAAAGRIRILEREPRLLEVALVVQRDAVQ